MNVAELREAIRDLAITGTGPWSDHERRLKELILHDDVSHFLDWDVIRQTMRWLPLGGGATDQLHALMDGIDDIQRWMPALREPPVGWGDMKLDADSTSSNTIHTAHHILAFERLMGLRVGDMGTILEFGGGYGCMCRMIRALGFEGKYILYDLPVVSALQRYYLDAVGVQGVTCISCLEELDASLSSCPGPWLFVATWSLSEAPLGVRDDITQHLKAFDVYLIAYQEEFDDIDNLAYFRGFQAAPSWIEWHDEEIPYLPGPSHYLMGRDV